MSNLAYQRNDEDCVPAVPQPASTPGTVDPGSTWETKPYLNFNGDYIATDDDGNPRTPQPYVARDEDGNPRVVGTYVKTDV